MNPNEYTGAEWKELLKAFNTKQLRNAMKSGYRRTAKKVRQIAVQRLQATGIRPKGNAADWPKGIRTYIYRKGGGFMVTVSGGRGRSQHTNRYGITKPVLQWVEDGTRSRTTKGRRRKAHSTGTMQGFHFIHDSEEQMYRTAESDLAQDLEQAVKKAAQKAGFI